MLKALLWKEWREQRGIAFAGAVVALLIPLIVMSIATGSGAPDLLEVADIVPFLFGALVWPLFAALAGATVNGESGSPASAGFLFSRPAPRWLVWFVKVGIAVVALAFVVALSFYAALRVDVWAGGRGFRFPFSSDPFPWPPDNAVQAMAVGALYITFCGAVFLSTFLRRSIGAAVGGLAIAVTAQLGVIFVAGRVSASSLVGGVEAFVQAFSIGLSMVLLGASLYVFRVSGLPGTSDARRNARRAWAGVGAALPFILVLAGFTSTRISPDTAIVRFELPVPGTDTSVVSLYGDAFSGASLWAAEPGRPLRPLTARMADAVAVSPDGEWLVYGSRLTAIGTRSPSCALRAVRLDGTQDRLLVAGAEAGSSRWCSYAGRFAPDGKRIAMHVRRDSGADEVLITGLDGGALRLIDLSEIEPRRYYSVVPEWISNDTLLLYSPYDSSNGYWRVDAETGVLESIYVPEDNVYASPLVSTSAQLLVHEREGRDSRGYPVERTPRRETTKLIEIADGRVHEIEPLCPPSTDVVRTSAALSPDGRRVFYSCRPPLPRDAEWQHVDPDELFRGALRRRDLSTGEDVVIAELDGYVSSFTASPDISRFVVRLADPQSERPGLIGARTGAYGGTRSYGRERRYTYRYVLVDADGTLLALAIPPDWSVNRWFDNDRIVLTGRAPYGVSSSLAYLELHDAAMELRPLYTPGSGGR